MSAWLTQKRELVQKTPKTKVGEGERERRRAALRLNSVWAKLERAVLEGTASGKLFESLL